MKKSILSFAVASVISGSALFATVPTFAAGMPMSQNVPMIHLNVNGINVEGNADWMVHMMPGDHVYASVPAFASYYGVKPGWDESTGTLTLNGQTVSNKYGMAHVYGGILTASVRAMAEAIGGDHFEIGWDDAAQQANVTILPAGVVSLDGHFVVPQMGEHWADPKNMPLGPIYGVYNGKLVFLEYMPDKDLNKTVHDIPGTTVPIPAKIDHTDIDWNPQGHPGDLNPHYDVHLYFISRDEQNKIK